MRFFPVLLALGLLPLPGADRAADTGAVRGGVIDAATKRAVEYATVTLKNKATGAVVRSGVTDAKGTFPRVSAVRDRSCGARRIRARDYLYIVNFRPDRWPLGDPYRLDGGNPPTVEELTEETRATLPDEDAGPTKAWLVGVRNDPKWKAHFEWVYGKRSREELYDLKADPQQPKNVAGEARYASTRAQLVRRLMDELKRTGDPRLVDGGKFFEIPPMSGPANEGPTKQEKAWKKKQ